MDRCREMKILGEDGQSGEIEPKVKRTEVGDSLAQLDMPENIEAVHVFSQVGSLAETSRRMGISIYELQRMSRAPWWQRELQGIQREQTALENVKLSRMWGMTLEKIEDMLEHGEIAHFRGKVIMKVDEEGVEIEPHRVPLSPSALAKFAEVLFNQRQLVREMPTAIVGNNSKLEELADKLSALGAVRSAKVIDADVSDIEGEENGSE